MAIQARQLTKADYGLDAPGLVKSFVFGGGAAAMLGIIGLIWGRGLFAGLGEPAAAILAGLAYPLFFTGAPFLLTGLAMIWSSRKGKLVARDRLLDGLRLRGDETVLDVACGHGLLLIGAAKRVAQGKAIGVDLWSQVDQGDNSKAATLANAAAERVMDRVEVLDGDMRALPLPGASVDAVVSSLGIHNLHSRADRQKTIQEIARVLRPGGTVAMLDIAHTAEYVEDLRAAGLRDARRSGLSFWIFPPVRAVTATKEPNVSSR